MNNEDKTPVDGVDDEIRGKIRAYAQIIAILVFAVGSYCFLTDPGVYKILQAGPLGPTLQNTAKPHPSSPSIAPAQDIAAAMQADGTASEAPAGHKPQSTTLIGSLVSGFKISKSGGQEVLKCLGLVALVLGLVGIASSPSTGLFHRNATEPFLSRQTQAFGLGLMLASGAIFWRGHSTAGWCLLALGLLVLVGGLVSEAKHNQRLWKEA